jgi:hypothetical protein
MAQSSKIVSYCNMSRFNLKSNSCIEAQVWNDGELIFG